MNIRLKQLIHKIASSEDDAETYWEINAPEDFIEDTSRVFIDGKKKLLYPNNLNLAKLICNNPNKIITFEHKCKEIPNVWNEIVPASLKQMNRYQSVDNFIYDVYDEPGEGFNQLSDRLSGIIADYIFNNKATIKKYVESTDGKFLAKFIYNLREFYDRDVGEYTNPRTFYSDLIKVSHNYKEFDQYKEISELLSDACSIFKGKIIPIEIRNNSLTVAYHDY